MKIRINLKDPDGFHDGVKDAVNDELAAADLPEDEKEVLRDLKTDKAWKVLRKWVSSGEYVSLEFDTETGTAKVLED